MRYLLWNGGGWLYSFHVPCGRNSFRSPPLVYLFYSLDYNELRLDFILLAVVLSLASRWAHAHSSPPSFFHFLLFCHYEMLQVHFVFSPSILGWNRRFSKKPWCPLSENGIQTPRSLWAVFICISLVLSGTSTFDFYMCESHLHFLFLRIDFSHTGEHTCQEISPFF